MSGWTNGGASGSPKVQRRSLDAAEFLRFKKGGRSGQLGDVGDVLRSKRRPLKVAQFNVVSENGR